MDKNNYKTLFLLLLLSLKISNSENIEELIKTKCDGKTIKYTIQANLKEYLENENNIDNKDTYNSLNDLKSKRIGIYTPTYRDNEKLKALFDNIKEYDNKDVLVTDIIKNRVDGGIIFHGLVNSIHMNSNRLSAFPEPLYSVKLGFGLQKNNDELKNQINQFIQKNKNNLSDLELYWDLVNNEAGYIDYNLSGNKTLNVIAKIDSSPYCYLRQFDNAFIGAEVDLIYKFARENGYKLNLKQAISYEEQYQALKENKADIALGFFVITEDKDISFSDELYDGNINLFVRYSNLPESHTWTTLYDSFQEFNGEKLGLQTGTFFDELINKYFPKSKIETQELISSLIKLLLLEEIEGFLLDKPIAEYLEQKYIWRLSYYDLEEWTENKNAFAFQKNKEGEALMKQFNDFLKTINLKEIYKKWMVADYEQGEYDPSQYIIDKNLDPNWELITVGMELDTKPISFYGQNEPKGIELEILYKFAKEKHYNINLLSINAGERLTYIKEGKANITGGSFSITEERKKDMYFSDPLYDSPIVLLVRLDSRKDKFPIEIQDSQFETKNNSNVDVNVRFTDKIKTSSCIFPSFFSDVILINCTIKDIKDVNVSNGFEYVNTTDKIYLLYNYLEADNFLQANSKISGHEDIIKESDKSEITCSSTSNTLIALLLLFVSVPTLIFILSKCK